MSEEVNKTLLKAPPRLLLGVAFLFWGAMHDHPLAALMAAVLVEGRNWTALRWEFGIKGFSRAWQISMVVLILASVGLLRGDEVTPFDFLELLSWLPFMMLPLALAQQYARDECVPTVTFSFIARRKMAADRKAGRPVELTVVHLGYPFFILILIGAGMGVGMLGRPGPEEYKYAGGVVILLGWAFFKVAGERKRPFAWVAAYGMALVLTGLMLWGLSLAYERLLKGMKSSGGGLVSASQTQTNIGKVHKLQLSPKILWRYYHERGEVPRLLKMASYNMPYRDFWRARLREADTTEKIVGSRMAGGDFETLFEHEDGVFSYEKEGSSGDAYERIGRLQGMISEDALIPHIKRTNRFEDVPADGVAVNSLGAFQISRLKQGAMEVRLFSGDGGDDIQVDPTVTDLAYPEDEERGLKRFLEEIGLEVPVKLDAELWERRYNRDRLSLSAEPSLPEISREKYQEIEGRLGQVFSRDFEYSLFLTGTQNDEPITEFLDETRKGHCEYFAGATAMLLRRMGVPCRYVVGFAVQEKGDEDEWVLRGQHAHAWVEAYVGGSWANEGSVEEPLWRCRGGEWVNVDLTPPNWAAAGVERPWYQWFSDVFQKIRAGLVLWSSRSGVASAFLVVLVTVVVLGLIYLIYRLVMSRGRRGKSAHGSWAEMVSEAGVLRDFERWLEKRVGSRPTAVPMGTWLRDQLGEDGLGLAEHYERVTFQGEADSSGMLPAQVKEAKRAWLARRKNPGG